VNLNSFYQNSALPPHPHRGDKKTARNFHPRVGFLNAVNIHKIRWAKVLEVASRHTPAPIAKITPAMEMVFGETPARAKSMEIRCEYGLLRAEMGLLSGILFLIILR
jgi:hypothetical protein